MRKMKTIWRTLILLAGLGASFPLFAQLAKCTSASGGPLNVPLYDINSQPITVDATAPLNSLIGVVLLADNASDRFQVTCTGATNTGDIASWLSVTRPKIAGTTMYESGVPGVGMRVFMRMQDGSSAYLATSIRNAYKWTPLSFVPQTELHLYRIGEIEAGRSIATGEIAEAITFGAGITNELKWMTFRLTDTIQVIPQAMTCGVTTPEIQVPLPGARATAFGGIGSTLGGQPFQIEMRCRDGVSWANRNVHVVLTDQSNPGNLSDTLTLSEGSSARGVGFQILKGSTVIRYGPDSTEAGTENRWLAGSTSNGDFIIPLQVRYVKTAEQVQQGSAVARATFTISYD